MVYPDVWQSLTFAGWLGTTSFNSDPIKPFKDLKFFKYKLFACLLPCRGRKPDRRRSRRRSCNADRGLSPPNPPPLGSNTVVIFTKESLAKPSLFSFWKDNVRYRKKKKKERNKTTHRTKMPGHTLLPFAHPLCLGTLSFAEGKIEYPTNLKRSLVFFSLASYLLAYCLAEGASPTADGAEGGLQCCCNADCGLSPPKPLAAIRS